MSSENGPSKARIDQGVREALVEAGYTLDGEGTKDNTKIRETMLGIVARAKVLSKGERDEKAVTRSVLVAELFPDLPGPTAWERQSDPVLASKVYAEVDKMVWGETVPNANKPLQRLVGIHFGNGYVLCRYRAGADRLHAVYVTDNVACIDQDYVRPDNERAQRVLANVTANREMLVLRQPDNAKHYVNGYKRTFKAALDTGSSQLELAMDSVTAVRDEDEEDTED